jgi:CubicO group peptidase (beta-lactamase class C family)
MSTTSTTDRRVEEALKVALDRGEEGLQVAAYLNDELIVDTWAGVADPATGRQVDQTTLFSVFSVVKALTVTALHVQAERGLIEYEAPIARYWPEFGKKGKERTTVRDALMHRAGIPMMPVGVTPELMYDWDWMVKAIEEYRPWFEPGTTNTYHVLVFGWIIGEIVRRTDPAQRPIGQFAQEEICEPLGIDGFFIGLPESEVSRVALLSAPWEPASDPDHLRNAAAPVEVFPGPPVHNKPETWMAPLPGNGGIANARSAAKFFSMLANGGEASGVRLLSADRVESFTEPRPDAFEPDVLYEFPCTIGAGGMWLGGDLPLRIPADGSRPRVLHQSGAGGSTAWAELDTGLSVAIFHNRMLPIKLFTPEEHPLMPIADAVRAVAFGGS